MDSQLRSLSLDLNSALEPFPYEIIEELGNNRSGGRVTYLAEDTRSNTKVALKQFQFAIAGSDWSGYEACDREIRALQGLDHPGIPRYLDSFETPNGFCLVQEYKAAVPLSQFYRASPAEVKQIAIALLEILVYLQDRVPPVIHRDIKPENILVGEKKDDRVPVYLVDFGFARIGGGEVAGSSTVKGTLGFMPPEQIFDRPLTPASDLYGVGASLVCVLTGTKSADIGSLFDSQYRLQFKHLLPSASPSWIGWLEKMVQPNASDRFPNAKTALAALNSIDLDAVPVDIPLPPIRRLALLLLVSMLFSWGFDRWWQLTTSIGDRLWDLVRYLWSG